MGIGKKKVIVIGIDGATFRIIDPLIREGRLPNIGGLVKNGVHGTLMSTVPAVSPVAWTSFMTGKNPGKHNIFDFFGKVQGEYRFKINSATDRRAKPFWVLLSEYDKRVCVSGITLTYPPDPVNGLMVTGLGTPASHSGCIFTSPPELSQEINDKLGEYHVLHKGKPKIKSTQGKDLYIKGTDELIEYRNRLHEHLAVKGDFDFSMFFFIDTDGTSHNFWKYMDGRGKPSDNERYGGEILRVYEKVDNSLGRIMARCGTDANYILVSDHGFGPLNRTVSLNAWLEAEKLLVFKKRSLLDEGQRFYKKVEKRLFRERGVMKGEEFSYLDEVDWESTKAFYYGTVGNIFINLLGREKDGIVKPDEYDGIRKKIAGGLINLVDPETGEKVVERVDYKEDIFKGDNVACAPDLVVTFKSGYGSFTGSPVNMSTRGKIIMDSTNWSGDHEQDGIFIASGPVFKKGLEVSGAQIADIAPTILYLLGVPVSDDMDGKPLTDVFNEEFTRENPVKYSEEREMESKNQLSTENIDNGAEEEMIKRLRNLGYIE